MASIYNEVYWRLFKVIWKNTATMRPPPSKIWIFGLILAKKHPTGKVSPGLKMISRPVEFMTKRCELLGKKWCEDSFQCIKCDWELNSDPYYSSKPIWKWYWISTPTYNRSKTVPRSTKEKINLFFIVCHLFTIIPS